MSLDFVIFVVALRFGRIRVSRQRAKGAYRDDPRQLNWQHAQQHFNDRQRDYNPPQHRLFDILITKS
jgi:hypothetical protein